MEVHEHQIARGVPQCLIHCMTHLAPSTLNVDTQNSERCKPLPVTCRHEHATVTTAHFHALAFVLVLMAHVKPV